MQNIPHDGEERLDETGADGGFQCNVRSDTGVTGFVDALREQLGIVVTPERRRVEWLVVRPR
jgi:hypothetical protein